ncbi:MAG: aminopeptidase [Deltaproteobacteria bacterium]|nr:aminopeptidase [Deltaproteobacteria bacterium]
MGLLCALLSLILCPMLLTSCAHGLYLGKLAWGEAQVLGGRVSNQEVLKDATIDEEIKEGIRLAQAVAEFSEKKLGLRADGCYKSFYHVKGDALIYLVSACPKDSLEPYTWRFPIVGEMEYKGFFNKKDAVKEIKRLEEQGFDTCLQHAIAFSTLGWLNDPIYSTILGHHPVVIINIIIHELVHNTVFFKGETALNEGLASFIAEKGTLLFITEQFGASSPQYQLALDLNRDEELISGVFEALYDALQKLYTQDITREEKIDKREEIFAHGQRCLADLNNQFKKKNFSVSMGGLNNAVVLAHRRYHFPSEGLIVKAYEALGEDLKGLVELLRTARKSKEEPSRFLEKWLQERSGYPPG